MTLPSPEESPAQTDEITDDPENEMQLPSMVPANATSTASNATSINMPHHIKVITQTDSLMVFEKNCRANFSLWNFIVCPLLGAFAGFMHYGLTTFGVPEGIFWLHAIIFYPLLSCLLLGGLISFIDESISLFNHTRIEVTQRAISVTNHPFCNRTRSIEFLEAPPKLSWNEVLRKVKRNNRTVHELVGYDINADLDENNKKFVLQTARAEDRWIVETVNNFFGYNQV